MDDFPHKIADMVEQYIHSAVVYRWADIDQRNVLDPGWSIPRPEVTPPEISLVGPGAEESFLRIRMHFASQGDFLETHIRDELDHVLEGGISKPLEVRNLQSLHRDECELVHAHFQRLEFRAQKVI